METPVVDTQNALLSKDIQYGTIPWVSGGDAEVNTKGGRSTIVEVRTENLRNFGTYVDIDVTYTVKEVWPDYTTLSRTNTIRMYAPVGHRIVSAGNGRSHCALSKSYPGKDHTWHDATGEVAGTFLAALAFRFDGGGRDDQGNSQMNARLEIPVVLAV